MANLRVEKINPELAEEMLGRNVANRNLRPLWVEAYARDMLAGHWRFVGDPIRIAKDGTLLDGQHRLAAIVASGSTLEMVVMRGLDRADQAGMDTGIRRTTGDALRLQGHAASGTTSAVARLAMAVRDDLPPDRATYTTAEVLTFVEAHPDIGPAAEVGAHYKRKIAAAPSVLGYVWWLLAAVDPDDAGRFYDSLANLQTEGAGDPRAALLRRLASAQTNRERMDRRDLAATFVRAWNAWRKGDALAKAQVRTRGRGAPTGVTIPEAV